MLSVHLFVILYKLITHEYDNILFKDLFNLYIFIYIILSIKKVKKTRNFK